MRVTFAKDLGLTVVYLKIIFILVKSIGPAAAGPAGPVPAPLKHDKGDDLYYPAVHINV